MNVLKLISEEVKTCTDPCSAARFNSDSYGSLVLYGCETWSLTQREEHRFDSVFQQGAKENIST